MRWITVRTKYHQGFIADIKALPRSSRMWNPETKVWLVDDIYRGYVERLAERHRIGIQIENLFSSDEPVDVSDSSLDDLSGIPIRLAMRLLEAKDAKARAEDRKAEEEDPGRMA